MVFFLYIAIYFHIAPDLHAGKTLSTYLSGLTLNSASVFFPAHVTPPLQQIEQGIFILS